MFRIIFILLFAAIAWFLKAPGVTARIIMTVVSLGALLWADFYLIQKVRFYKVLTAGMLLGMFSLILFSFSQILGVTYDIPLSKEIMNSTILYLVLLVFYIAVNYAESATYFRKQLAESPGDTKYIVDTSAIIDGRLKGICEAGFLTTSLVIPEFVIRELQLISDSSNHEKRKKGRRGLDIMRNMKESNVLSINIPSIDYDFLKGVDNKLLHYAREIKGFIITTDYNLYKVAQVEGINVINVNSIATVLKPNYNIGDKIKVNISKKGNNKYQGVGYMEDDTMVVVEDGEKFIGQTKTVQVTSYVQSSSGKMVFCKLP